jgi:AsmA protein
MDALAPGASTLRRICSNSCFPERSRAMSSTPPGSIGQSGPSRDPRPVRIEPILSAAPGGAPTVGHGMPGPGAAPRQPSGAGASRPRGGGGASGSGGGRSWLWIIGGTLTALAILLGGAVAALYVFLSPDVVKDRLVREVKERTGRDLTIGGTPRISFWPNIAVSMSNVALSNPPGLAGPPTVTMAALEADVQLRPLLSREVVVDRILLRGPVVDLRVDGAGRRNWDFAEWLIPGGATGRVRYAQAAQPSRTDAGAGAGGQGAPRKLPAQLEKVTLGSLQVVNGTVRYSDERAKVAEEVKALDMTMSAETIAAPLDAKGSLNWRGEALQFTARLAPLRAALEQTPVAVTARINGQAVDASYEGNATFGSDLVLDGRLSAKSDAPERLARLAGRTIDPQALAGGVRITTGVKAAAQSLTLSDARLDALGATTTGTLTVDTKGVRPHLRGNLRFSELDVNKLQRLAGIEPAQRPQQQANRPQQPGPGSLEDIIKQGPSGPAANPAARPRPETKGSGWSTDPIDTAFLGLADADLKIQFGKLSAANVTTGPGQATVAHRNRAADVTVEDIALYQGRGRGRVTVNGTGPQVQVGANILGENLTAQSFFKDFGGPAWLFGRLRVALAVTAQGQSQYQLAQSLNGRGELTVADGWVIGFNVAELLRNLGQGRFSGLEAQPTQKTDFTEAAATFAITNGVARNNDLRVASPLMRVGGAGSLNIAERTVDYTLRPRLVGSTQGQGAAADGGGLEIPVRVTGPLDAPALAPDLSGLVKDPNQALEAIKRIDPKAAEGAIKGLLGGDGDAQQKARDILNQFLKR